MTPPASGPHPGGDRWWHGPQHRDRSPRLGSTPRAGTSTRLDNDGTVNATHDLVVYRGAGVSTGTYTAAAGATLTVTDTTVAGATITGAGGVDLAGTVTANGAGLSVTTGHANITGTLTGPGAKTLGGDSSWTGTISGSGPVTVPAGGTLSVPSYCATLDGATLTNLGTLSLASEVTYSCVQLANGATIENAGTLRVR